MMLISKAGHGKLWFLFTLVIVLSSTIPGFAQHSIKGRVINEQSEPLTYANVVLLSPADSTLQYHDIADQKGQYQIKHIKAGHYLMQFSFVGMEIIYEDVAIPSELGEDFGDKVMKAKTVLDELVVTAEYAPIEINQDTVAFNAKAFKVKAGAAVEDLLKQMPGIEVDKTGNVKALGEDVTRVLVDGKEFFGKDPKVATKNLPADAIDKVQVYDKKTDEAEFTGIDDGVRDRTINLLLNEDKKKGYFGNAGAGGGTGSHYNTQGKLYRFSSTVQSALLGMYNNVNEFRFTGKDNESWGRKISGLNTTVAGGLNMSYNAEKYNRYFFSYLVNSTKTDLQQKTTTENFVKDGAYDQTEDLTQDERDTPHKANFGVRHRFNANHNVLIDGDVNVAASNKMSRALRNTRQNDVLIDDDDNRNSSRADQINFSVKGTDIVKLNNGDTQVKTSVSASYQKSDSESDWTNTAMLYNPDRIVVNDQFQDNKTNWLRLSASPALVQKIASFWYVNAGVNVGALDNNLDRRHGKVRHSNAIVNALSADFNTQEMFVSPSVSLQRSSGKAQFNVTFETSWRQFDKVLDDRSVGKLDYFHFVPRLSYSNNYREGRRIQLRYGSSVNIPDINQLLPVANTTNRLSVYQGNIDLLPEYRHNASLTWSVFDHFSFTSLFARFSAEYTKDKISWSQTIHDDFTQRLTPVNVPDHYTASTLIDFSAPIRALGIKVNAKARESWSRGIAIQNSEDNIQTIFVHALDLNFENRKQDKLDITLGGSVSVTDSRFSIVEDNVFYSTSYYTDIGFTPNDQWRFEVEANVANFNSKNFDEAVSIPLINAGISYHLNGGRASFTLQGFDLLNKNTSFKRISETNYLLQQERNTIGRYVMFAFNRELKR